MTTTTTSGRRPGKASRPGRGSRLGPHFLRLWIASTVTNLADGIQLAALPLLAAALTRDPLTVSGVAVAGRLPWLLVALQAGVMADRHDRGRLMVLGNLVRGLALAGLAVAVAVSQDTIWLLYAVSFGIGVVETIHDNAAQSLLPAIVPRDQLEQANGHLQSTEIVANQMVGPPLGGFLFAIAAAAPIALGGGAFLGSAVLLLGLAGASTPVRGTQTIRMRTQVFEGVRWLWGHDVLRTLAIMLGLANGFWTAIMAILPLFALDVLDVTPFGYGLLLSAFAVGGVAGSQIAPRLVLRLGRARALVAAWLGFSLPVLAMGMIRDPWAFGALQAVAGVAVVTWNVITVSLRQTIIPDHLLGRVNSVYRFLGWGAMPLGALLGGGIASVAGLQAPFIVSGVAMLLAMAWFLRVLTTEAVESARAAANSNDESPQVTE